MAKKNLIKEIEKQEENNQESLELTPQVNDIITKIENKINETTDEINKKISDVKIDEAELMKKIQENPESIEDIVRNEIKLVDDAMKNTHIEMEKLTQSVKNNKKFTSNSWNGWGYDL